MSARHEPARLRADPPWKRRSIRAVSTNAGDAGCRTHSQVARRGSQSAEGGGALAVCPMCAPAVQPALACYCNLHVNHAMLAPDQIDAMPSQREGQGFESP